MGLDLLTAYGLVLAKAGMTVEERIGFLIGLEFAGQVAITPEQVNPRVNYYRAEFNRALSKKLVDATREPVKPPPAPKSNNSPIGQKSTKAQLEAEHADLKAKATKAQGEIGSNEHALENILRYGERMKAIEKRLERRDYA